MEINSLKLLIDVANLGSFAAAARKHQCDPSQVSRTVAALEKNLCIRIFNRSTRKLALTEAGERYIARIKPLLEEMTSPEEEARELSQTPSGLLRITASNAFGQICLLPHLPKFYQAYPEIEIELQLTDSNLDLLTNDIDLACRISPSMESDLIGVKLFDISYRVCASPGYLQKNAPILQPSDLSQHQCVLLTLPQHRAPWLFFDGKGQLVDEVRVKSRLFVSNALAKRDLLVRDVGPTLAASWLVEEYIQTGELVDLFPDLQVGTAQKSPAAWLLYPSRKYLPAKARVMIDFLKEIYPR